jgi:hypothetical protein
MKSITVSFHPHIPLLVHKYDIRLCHFIDANQGYCAAGSDPPIEC